MKPLWTFTPLDTQPDEKALAQIENCMEDERAVAGALMADHHLGYSMPIGGVIAYDGAVSPSGVGYDIACGNMAVQTTLKASDLTPGGALGSAKQAYEDIKPIMREIQKSIAFGVGRRNANPVDHALFDNDLWPEIEDMSPGLKEKAQAQLGTVGSGNHYVDILLDEDDYVWVANHFGSRGFGHTIATLFLDQGDSEAPTVLDLHTNRGALYFACMNLAGEYAYAGREHVMQQVLGIIGNPKVTKSVHNHHNFAWEENGHIIVRKGATPLTRAAAFIGGSMGDVSMIVRGKNHPVSTATETFPLDIGALGSAPHGAGRIMSRTKAAGKMKKVTLESGKRVRMRDKSTAAID